MRGRGFARGSRRAWRQEADCPHLAPLSTAPSQRALSIGLQTCRGASGPSELAPPHCAMRAQKRSLLYDSVIALTITRLVAICPAQRS